MLDKYQYMIFNILSYSTNVVNSLYIGSIMVSVVSRVAVDWEVNPGR